MSARPSNRAVQRDWVVAREQLPHGPRPLRGLLVVLASRALTGNVKDVEYGLNFTVKVFVQ